MKQIIYLLILLALVSCGRSRSEPISDTIYGNNTAKVSDTIAANNFTKVQQDSTEGKGSQVENRKQLLNDYKKATFYNLTDTITADFNGDGILDKAFYKKEKETSGIIIKHGQTNEEFKIGFGKPFAEMKEFDWVDYWGLVEDKETSETTFADDGDVLGSKTVKLQNPSIALGASELGGGLITFIHGKYVWIHQTC
jgi:hypothetical protein